MANTLEEIGPLDESNADEVLLQRIKAAIFLVMAAPEYLVQK